MSGPTVSVPLPTAGSAPGSPSVGTRLIPAPGDRQVLIPNYETDVRTAVTRGLAEYLSQLDITWSGGRYSRFKATRQTWASPEDPAQYPSACVYAMSPGEYDSTSWSPRLTSFAPNQYLTKTSELLLDVIVDIYCTDPKERVALTSLMELAFVPVDWMYGFLLELPHYFNARATFEATTSEYQDSEEDAQMRRRIVQFTLKTTCPVLQLRGEVPPMQVRTEVTLADIDVGTGEIVNSG